MSLQWHDLIETTGRQAQLFLDWKRDTREYQPHLHVTRQAIEGPEGAFERFISSDRVALLLVGGSGVGKTTLLCHFAQQKMADGHPVLLYDGAQIEGAPSGRGLSEVLARNIARDMGREPSPDLWRNLDRLLAEQGKYLFLVFDSVARFVYGDSGVRELLLSLNTLIRGWRSRGLTRLKVVISCISSAWDLLPGLNIVQWNLYLSPPGRPQQPWFIGSYTGSEFQEAYEKYMGVDPEGNAFARVRDLCQGNPYLLRLISDLDEPPSERLTTKAMFDAYYEQRILSELPVERDAFLRAFAEKMIEEGSDDVPTERLDTGKAYQSLIREGVLVRGIIGRNGGPRPAVCLHHARLSEYILTRYLRWRYREGIDAAHLTDLIEKAGRGFSSLWEALGNVLGERGTAETFLALTETGSYAAQDMARDGLIKAGVEREEQIAPLLRELFGNQQAWPVALSVAVELRRLPDVWSEFIQWATQSEQSQVANYLALLWREYRETQWGDSIWDELRAIRDDLLKQNVRELESDRVIRFVASVTWRILLNDFYDEKSVQRLSQFWSETWQQSLELLSFVRLYLFRHNIRTQLHKHIEWVLRHFLEEFAGSGSDRSLPTLPVFPPVMQQVARLLDYEADDGRFQAARAAILSLLRTEAAPETRLHVVIAAMAVVVQTMRDFEQTRPTLLALFQDGGFQERLAILNAFSIYAPGRPHTKDFVDAIGDLTGQFLEQHSVHLTELEDPWGLARKWEMTLSLAPLGFAYCNLPPTSGRLPFIEPIVALQKQVPSVPLSCFVRDLAPVGIYFPIETLVTLRDLGAFQKPELAEETKKTLRIIHSFHRAQVADFLRKEGFQGDFEPRLLIGADLDQLLTLTQWIGNLNFFYHASRFPFPRSMVIGSLLGLSAKDEKIERLIKAFSRELADVLIKAELSLDRLFYGWEGDPEAVIKRLAGRGYDR